MDNLRDRVQRLLSNNPITIGKGPQLSLAIAETARPENEIRHPSKSISGFLDFLSDVLPDGDVYLFGGLLRDLALHGRRGFSSDIDLVVEGDWSNCSSYLESLGATLNKFGGYRLNVAGWPVDIWEARQSWAFRQGLARYEGISSLTKTTVLNWDAILMNWRTRSFVHTEGYIDAINERVLDVVLPQNPNPLGMAIRVFRHLRLKDARRITTAAATYLASCTARYRLEELQNAEVRSYGSSVIDYNIYRYFQHIGTSSEELSMGRKGLLAARALREELELF